MELVAAGTTSTVVLTQRKILHDRKCVEFISHQIIEC